MKFLHIITNDTTLAYINVNHIDSITYYEGAITIFTMRTTFHVETNNSDEARKEVERMIEEINQHL